MSEDPDREIWRKLADATKPDAQAPEDELPKAEDFVEGPLPETSEEAAERQRKLEAAQRAEAAKAAEEARRVSQIQSEEAEFRRREEEARRRIEEEARKHREEQERRIREEAERKHREEAELRRSEAEERKREEEAEKKPLEEVAPKAKPSYAPEGENLLLQGLVNLLQPALDIKLESKRYQRWIKGWDRAIEMHIVGEGYTHVLIKDNQMKAGLGKPLKDPDIVMEGDYETITNYLNGELDPILKFFDFVLLRKIRLVKGLEIKLKSILDGSLFRQARDLYRMDKILRIR